MHLIHRLTWAKKSAVQQLKNGQFWVIFRCSSLGLQLIPRHELREVERGDGADPPVCRGRALLPALPGFVLRGVDYLLDQGSVGLTKQ